VESDSYDRAVFKQLEADAPSLQALGERGGKLLPHFDAFLLDLFAILFKMNIVLYPEPDVLPSAAFYRALIDQLRVAPALDILRQQTVLDETRAGLATVLLGDRLLRLLKSERILSRAEMLDFWNLEQQETELSEAAAHMATADVLHQHARPATQRRLGDLTQRIQRETEPLERRLRHKARQVRAALTDQSEQAGPRIQAQAEGVLHDLEQAVGAADSWGMQPASSEHSPIGAQIELGKRLATNPKLQKLAHMVGHMRAYALALRRKMLERVDEETYTIGLGAELSRLLAHETVALRHPLLRRDFDRRLLDAQLLQYALRGPDEKGKGPMVVCLDGSSSMAGDKEIWSKAVSLTLLEIAQRQRRLFRCICFSSATTPLHVLDLNRRQRYSADLNKVLELAEYFPGGGTDFQKPLAAALECLRQARYRRGDIVFITDGECRVDEQWLTDFKQAKEQLGFSLLSVVIDVGSNTLGTLAAFSDKVTTVSQLTNEAGKDIFLKVA